MMTKEQRTSWIWSLRSEYEENMLAYHEAGHLVVGLALGIAPLIITIVPKGKVGGYCGWRPGDLDAMKMAIVSMGGVASESYLQGKPFKVSQMRRVRAKYDLQNAQLYPHWRQLAPVVQSIMDKQWTTLVAPMAEELKVKGELTPKDMMDVLKRLM